MGLITFFRLVLSQNLVSSCTTLYMRQTLPHTHTDRLPPHRPECHFLICLLMGYHHGRFPYWRLHILNLVSFTPVRERAWVFKDYRGFIEDLSMDYRGFIQKCVILVLEGYSNHPPPHPIGGNAILTPLPLSHRTLSDILIIPVFIWIS